MGYYRAGFEVVGVDIEPQPRYPFEFHQGDALEFLAEHGHEFDVIHASPPCQAYSPLNAYNKKEYPDLVAPTRELLRSVGVPYIIENVPQAPLIDNVLLCGAMFDVRVYRHRAFETSWALAQPDHPKHAARCARNGYLPADDQFMTITGGRHSNAWLEAAKDVMDMPWISTIREVCEAIPPAYTQYIGEQYLAPALSEASE